jgi:hypothetical protein
VRRGISPAAAVADNTAFVSQICDTLGYESSEFVILTGALADADAVFTTLVEDGDDPALADAAAVEDKFLLGTEALASFTFAEDNKARKIGYVGPKRYWRVTITPANNAGNAFIAGAFINGHPRSAPTANPPA